MAGILKRAMGKPDPNEEMEPADEEAAETPEEEQEEMSGEESGPGAANDEAQEGESEGEDQMAAGHDPATPEEEEAYQRAVALAQKALAAPGQIDRMIQSAKQGGVEQAIAQVVSIIVEQADKRLDLPETVILGFASTVAALAWSAMSKARLVREDDAQRLSGALQATFEQLSHLYDFDPQEAAQVAQQAQAGGGQ